MHVLNLLFFFACYRICYWLSFSDLMLLFWWMNKINVTSPWGLWLSPPPGQDKKYNNVCKLWIYAPVVKPVHYYDWISLLKLCVSQCECVQITHTHSYICILYITNVIIRFITPYPPFMFWRLCDVGFQLMFTPKGHESLYDFKFDKNPTTRKTRAEKRLSFCSLISW